MDLVLASRVLPRYIPHQAMDFGNEKQRSAGFLAMVPPVEWQRTVLCVRTCMCTCVSYVTYFEVDQCHLVG